MTATTTTTATATEAIALTDADMWIRVADERRRLADELELLTDEQWDTQTGCGDWTVREVAAHLLMPFELSTAGFMKGMFRHGFSFDRLALSLTAVLADRYTNQEIIDRLRDAADDRWTPMGPFGVEVPLGEIVVHGQDIRRSLGMDCPVPASTVNALLEAIGKKLRVDYERRI